MVFLTWIRALGHLSLNSKVTVKYSNYFMSWFLWSLEIKCAISVSLYVLRKRRLPNIVLWRRTHFAVCIWTKCPGTLRELLETMHSWHVSTCLQANESFAIACADFENYCRFSTSEKRDINYYILLCFIYHVLLDAHGTTASVNDERATTKAGCCCCGGNGGKFFELYNPSCQWFYKNPCCAFPWVY